MHQKVGGKCPRKKPKIEDATQPAVLSTVKVEVITNAEDRSVTQCSLPKKQRDQHISLDYHNSTMKDHGVYLVNIKESITDSQVGQNHEVNFP